MFVTQEELDKGLLIKAETVNKLLEDIVLRATETTLRSIPVMIGKLLQVTSATQELVKAVYSANPEFQNYKELVAMTIQDVESQFPGLTFQQVIDKAVPIIKQKIVEYDKIVKTTAQAPTVQEMQSRLNGAI